MHGVSPPVSKANTWCSYESWTLYDYDSDLPRPPNRLSHELGQEQMRIFAMKLQDVESWKWMVLHTWFQKTSQQIGTNKKHEPGVQEHQRFFKKHILEKRSEHDEQPASSCMPRFISKYKYFLSSAKWAVKTSALRHPFFHEFRALSPCSLQSRWVEMLGEWHYLKAQRPRVAKICLAIRIIHADTLLALDTYGLDTYLSQLFG